MQTVAPELKAKRHVARSWLGISTSAWRGGHGALVVAVERDGPSDRAGIAPGDVIVRVGNKHVQHAQDVDSAVIGTEPGTRMQVEIVRSGNHAAVDVQLAQPPTKLAAP